jgi:hypothetical protein
MDGLSSIANGAIYGLGWIVCAVAFANIIYLFVIHLVFMQKYRAAYRSKAVTLFEYLREYAASGFAIFLPPINEDCRPWQRRAVFSIILHFSLTAALAVVILVHRALFAT